MLNSISIKKQIYHGTVTPFDTINLKKGKDYKDFGKGFYLAYYKEQSISLAKRNLKNIPNANVCIYTYETNQEYFLDLYNKNKVLFFSEANLDWIDFVIKCRNIRGTWHDYSVVIGPTADDNTRLCMDFYNQGVYGKIGSIEAKTILLNNLEPEKLKTQVFIADEIGLGIINQDTRLSEVIK